jgi:hypothetical protein
VQLSRCGKDIQSTRTELGAASGRLPTTLLCGRFAIYIFSPLIERMVLARPSGTSKLPMNDRLAKILELPNELLLQIAQGIDVNQHNNDLSSLSLVCRRLCRIAQEPLLSTAIVYPRGVQVYTTKMTNNPACVAKITKLERDDYHRWRIRKADFALLARK